MEILNLCYNKISDINILSKVNFKELKKLDLFNNEISDIRVFDLINFKKLEILNIGENDIDKEEYSSTIENLKMHLNLLLY